MRITLKTGRHLALAALATLITLGSIGCGGSASKDAPASKSITQFSIISPVTAQGVINQSNATIAVTVPHGTAVTELVAEFTYSGESVTVDGTEQVSGTTANDFTTPVTYTVTATDQTTLDYVVIVTVAPSSAKEITAFSFEEISVTASIDQSTNAITATVPYGTDRSALIAKFTTTGASVSISGIAQSSGYTANNFTSPKTYTVTAADGTTRNYTVTVSEAASDAKAITAFAIVSPVAATGIIDEANHTITVNVPYGTAVNNMRATFSKTGLSVKVNGVVQYSGSSYNDFTSPVTYQVVAYDNSTQDYVVTVNLIKSSAKQLTMFKFLSPNVTGTINQTDHTVALTVPYSTNLTSLKASFSASTYATVKIGATVQTSNVTVNDFTNPVVYTVVAQDDSTQDYTVTVTKAAASSAKDFSAYSVAGANGVINTTAGTIAVTPAQGVSLTSIAATFTVSANATVKVGSTAQTSGVTTNTFTSPVVYTVTAEDGSTKDYTVTVTPYEVSSTWSNPPNGYASYLVEADINKKFRYSLNLGSSTKDVYFIYTNVSPSSSVFTPTLGSIAAPLNNEAFKPDTRALEAMTANNRGTAAISEYNRTILKQMGMYRSEHSPLRNEFPQPQAPNYDTVGGIKSFMNESTSDLIPSTCRKVVTANGITLNVWVANDCWHATGSSKANYVTQAMVDALADKFLLAGTGNDIYEWVTNVFGDHWGTPGYTNMIGDTNEITILLFDIDADNSVNGGTLGFFWAKDNFKTSYTPYSNERLMFYIDAVMFATEGTTTVDDGSTWDMTDFWPAELTSTLAHEFQHMINFYQKCIVHGSTTGSETWLNELCAMAAEDLVATKLQVDGPRGVAYTDGTAGSANNLLGRLPLFNFYNDDSLTNWLSGDDSLRSYSINYAFGAYLARNFGGAAFFNSVLSNEYTDYRAIQSAVSASGYSDTFATLLRKFQIATMLSDKTDTTAGFKMNSGTWFSSILNSTTYQLGSINFFNYKYGSQVGPYVYTNHALIPSTLYKASSTVFKAGTNVSGLQSWNITLPANAKLSVVVK